MTFRLPETYLEHAAMIRGLAADLRRKGYLRIRADHQAGSDWEPPPLVYSVDATRSMRPDLEAWRGDCRILFEVETIDTITSRQTRNEVEILSEIARTRENHFFYLVVPDSCKHLSLFVLRMLNVQPGSRTFILHLTPDGPQPSPKRHGFSAMP